MKLIFTVSQVPELREFKPHIRRFHLDRAYKQLFAEKPKLRWLPFVFCFIGASVGLILACALPEELYILADDPMKLFVPSIVSGIVAALAVFTGFQILVHGARHYLRGMLETSPAEKEAKSAI